MVFLGARLLTMDGSILAPPGMPQVTNTSCVSSGRLCDMCCYGNGVCDAGACTCESGFSASDNCGKMKKSGFFSQKCLKVKWRVQRGLPRHAPPIDENVLNFMQFFGKIFKIVC